MIGCSLYYIKVVYDVRQSEAETKLK